MPETLSLCKLQVMMADPNRLASAECPCSHSCSLHLFPRSRSVLGVPCTWNPIICKYSGGVFLIICFMLLWGLNVKFSGLPASFLFFKYVFFSLKKLFFFNGKTNMIIHIKLFHHKSIRAVVPPNHQGVSKLG